MQATRVNLTFFYDESRIAEHEIRSRLEKLLVDQFPEVRDRDVHWQTAPAAGSPQDLEAKLDRLDT
ncbi:MAG TPA: hypothetical protein VFY10_07685 [Dehalococcoidia bacterium]|nr:hypothetical protein [Dehalococcoidia bacterium]